MNSNRHNLGRRGGQRSNPPGPIVSHCEKEHVAQRWMTTQRAILSSHPSAVVRGAFWGAL